MNPAFAKAQRGGAFGTLIFLVIVALAGYYVYTEWFQDGGRKPSCNEASQACIKECRRTSTDQASIAACQADCQRKLSACDRASRRAVPAAAAISRY